MKLSWTSIKISIAGARLSHLAQKDRIWDHGSMAEQARIIFYLVQKAKTSGNIESLKKQCSISCFQKIKTEMEKDNYESSPVIISPVIKEIAIVDVRPGKDNRSDMFRALIKGVAKDDPSAEFKAQCLFVRQSEWWVLDEIK